MRHCFCRAGRGFFSECDDAGHPSARLSGLGRDDRQERLPAGRRVTECWTLGGAFFTGGFAALPPRYALTFAINFSLSPPGERAGGARAGARDTQFLPSSSEIRTFPNCLRTWSAAWLQICSSRLSRP